MPYQLVYVPAEVFMEYNGVTVYHVYKGDDPDQGLREFIFDTQENSEDDGGYDVRELLQELGQRGLAPDEDEWEDEFIMAVFRSAIDEGLVVSKDTE